MLWLRCPSCGRRPVEEFTFGGEQRAPDPSIADPAARDVDYAWMYDNPNGPTTERWFHHAGCRRWLTVRRDAHTDTLIG